MSKLEEYRDKKAEEESKGCITYKEGNFYRMGFDAAIALDLPVKFAEWREGYIAMLLAEFDQKYYQTRDEYIPHKERAAITHQSTKKLYKYWLDNVYKPE